MAQFRIALVIWLAIMAWALLYGQQPQPSAAIVQMQHLTGNPPRCPVCRQPVDLAPVELLIVGSSGALDGSTLQLPVMVCPRDGVMFTVRP